MPATPSEDVIDVTPAATPAAHDEFPMLDEDTIDAPDEDIQDGLDESAPARSDAPIIALQLTVLAIVLVLLGVNVYGTSHGNTDTTPILMGVGGAVAVIGVVAVVTLQRRAQRSSSR